MRTKAQALRQVLRSSQAQCGVPALTRTAAQRRSSETKRNFSLTGWTAAFEGCLSYGLLLRLLVEVSSALPSVGEGGPPSPAAPAPPLSVLRAMERLGLRRLKKAGL